MQQSIEKLSEKMKNVLEYPAFYLHPELAELKASLLKHGASAALMSGSGATFFGFFRKGEAQAALQAADFFQGKGYFTFVSGDLTM